MARETSLDSIDRCHGSRRRSALLAGLALLTVLGPVALAQTAPAPAEGDPRDTGQAPTYLVGPRDVLSITVYGHADLTGRFVVAPDGSIDFPLIGQLEAAGRAADAIAADLEQRLADGYLKEPQVAVQVAEFLSKRVYVVGEVRMPGPVALTGNFTLLEALARAGPVGDSAGAEIVVIRRGADAGTQSGPVLPGQPGAAQVLRYSLRDVELGLLNENVRLGDGDTVFVPKAEKIFVLGQVKSPGSFQYTQGLTVFQAISLAGGVTSLGSTGRVRIIRMTDGTTEELKAKPTDLVQPGDTVMVPTRWF